MRDLSSPNGTKRKRKEGVEKEGEKRRVAGKQKGEETRNRKGEKQVRAAASVWIRILQGFQLDPTFPRLLAVVVDPSAFYTHRTDRGAAFPGRRACLASTSQ